MKESRRTSPSRNDLRHPDKRHGLFHSLISDSGFASSLPSLSRSYSDLSQTTLSGNIPLDRLQQQVDIAEAAAEEPVGLDFRKAKDILAVDRRLHAPFLEVIMAILDYDHEHLDLRPGEAFHLASDLTPIGRRQLQIRPAAVLYSDPVDRVLLDRIAKEPRCKYLPGYLTNEIAT